MKKIISTIAAVFLMLSMFLPQLALSQSPEKMSFQAVIRNSTDDLLTSAQIGMQISIVEGTPDGTVVYTETHTPTTNVNGLVSIEIGGGAGFSDIDWGSGIYFIKTETDPTGGTNYTLTGTSQLLSVPYALHALSSSDNYWSKNGTVVHNTSDNIGIGSDVLNAKLGILHNSSPENPHILLHEVENDYARIRFQNSNGNNYWTIDGYIASNAFNDRLNFWNGTNGNLMSLTGDGQLGLGVGIGPKTELHVGNDMKVLFGTDTLGAGDKLMWLPNLHAFRVGTLGAGVASDYWNNEMYYDNFHEMEMNYIGQYSFASGLNTRAQGYGATAMGRDTEASNNYAFASGYFSNADGKYSTAMGYNTDAFGLGSTALGYASDAEQDYSFAVGHTAEAQAIYSMAIGDHVQAQSYASIAVGSYNVGGGNATEWEDNSPLFEIGNGTGLNSRSNAMTVLKNGKMGIGTLTPDARVRIDADADEDAFKVRISGGTKFKVSANGAISNYNAEVSATFAVNLQNSATDLLGRGRAFSWNTYSDRRIKSSIREINYGLQTIMKLRPTAYDHHSALIDEKSGASRLSSESVPDIGLIAQEVYELVPESVSKPDNDEDLWSMDYSRLVPVLIKGMQEQQDIIDDQKSEIESLTANQIDTNERLNKIEALLNATLQQASASQQASKE